MWYVFIGAAIGAAVFTWLGYRAERKMDKEHEEQRKLDSVLNKVQQAKNTNRGELVLTREEQDVLKKRINDNLEDLRDSRYSITKQDIKDAILVDGLKIKTI